MNTSQENFHPTYQIIRCHVRALVREKLCLCQKGRSTYIQYVVSAKGGGVGVVLVTSERVPIDRPVCFRLSFFVHSVTSEEGVRY